MDPSARVDNPEQNGLFSIGLVSKDETQDPSLFTFALRLISVARTPFVLAF
jgi:hypothetical protein